MPKFRQNASSLTPGFSEGVGSTLPKSRNFHTIVLKTSAAQGHQKRHSGRQQLITALPQTLRCVQIPKGWVTTKRCRVEGVFGESSADNADVVALAAVGSPNSDPKGLLAGMSLLFQTPFRTANIAGMRKCISSFQPMAGYHVVKNARLKKHPLAELH